MAKSQTVCRCCWSGCGILVDIEDGEVLSVRGDPEHPVSKGYICPKATALAWTHHREDRLNQARLHGQPSAWEPMLDDLARTIERAVAAGGPDAVGSYIASGASSETLGSRALGRFMAAIGSKELYSARTIDIAPPLRAAELVTGFAYDFIPRWDPEDADSKLVLFVGTNPLVSHGYMTVLADPARRMRAYQKRGGRIWVMDPQRTHTARIADRHLAALPGRDPLVLAWLVREVLAALPTDAPAMQATRAQDRQRLAQALAPFHLDVVSELSGLPAEDLRLLLADIRGAGRIAVVGGTGMSFGPHALLGEWLRWALLILTDSVDEKGGMWVDVGWLAPMETRTNWKPAPETPDLSVHPVSRPDLPRFAGENPCAALRDQIEHGPLRVLIVAGGNPLISVPNPDGMAAAFRKLDALAVYDVVDNPLSRMATHLMPAPDQFERLDLGGLYYGRAAVAEPVIPRGEGRRPLWWIAAKLAQRLGFADKVLPGADPDTVTEHELLGEVLSRARDPEGLMKAGGNGVDAPRHYGWMRKTAVPEGIWRLAPSVLVDRLPELLTPQPPRRPMRLISRRMVRLVNSFSYDQPDRAVEAPDLLIAAADARAQGISDGARVRVTSDNGQVSAIARIKADLRPGVVSLPHGWPGTNVSHLTSDRNVDRLTSQPQMSAIPVSLELEPA